MILILKSAVRISTSLFSDSHRLKYMAVDRKLSCLQTVNIKCNKGKLTLSQYLVVFALWHPPTAFRNLP